MSLVLRTQPARRSRRRKAKTQVVSISVPQRSQGKRGKKRRSRRKRRGGPRSLLDFSMGKGLSKAHPYIKSLLDPEQHTGRIPDVNNYHTTTYQVVEAFELTTSSDGAVGFVISPTPVTPSTSGYAHAWIGNAVETTATVGVWGSSLAFNASSSTTITNNMENFRPVSGCVCAEYIGDTQTDAGSVTCLPIFRSQQAPVKRSDAELRSYNQTLPLRNGIRCLWRPLDNGDLEFHGGGDPAGTDNLPSISYGFNGTITTVPRNISPIGERCPAGICLIISGATASKKVMRVRCVFNYESVPVLMSTGLFTVANVPADKGVIDVATNLVKQLPWAEAWQGVAGQVGKIGQEMAQSAFSAAGQYVGTGVLSALRASRNTRYAELDLD